MSGNIRFCIDSVEKTESGVKLCGWAVGSDGKEVAITPKEAVESYELKRITRPDLATALTLKTADQKLGFELTAVTNKHNNLHLIFSEGEDSIEGYLRPDGIMKKLGEKKNRLTGNASRMMRQFTLDNAKKFFKAIVRGGPSLAISKLRDTLRKQIRVDYQTRFLQSRPSKDELMRQRKESKKFDYQPLISILVPMYNTPPKFLEEMIASVTAQSYQNWELCLADGSDNEKLVPLMARYLKKDKRIKYNHIGENKGISGNTNEALALATGDYIALFDHDDLLTEEALYEIVKVLNEESILRPDFIYTDEDKVNAEVTSYFEPHFKPDFAPDTLRSNNYICHFTVIAKELLEKAGRYFDSNCDGAQDYDIILRATEKATRVYHIPKVLYHWRVHKNSTAGTSGSKPYTHEAGRRAIEAHLKRIGRKGKVLDGAQGRVSNIYKVEYEIEHKGKVSIIIPSYSHLEDLEKCITSILEKTTYPDYEILVVENNSPSGDPVFDYYKKIEQNERIKVLHWPREFNYSAINNWAAKEATGEYLMLLNNDIEIITPDWLEQMVMFAQYRENAIVGAKLYYPDGKIQHGGLIVGIYGVAGHAHRHFDKNDFGYFARLVMVQNLSAVTAALMLVRRDVFDEVGGFEEKFQVAFNDVDFCLKVRSAGYNVIFNPEVEAWHYESKSRGIEDTEEKQERFTSEINLFYERWGEFIVDPYYNVNLALDSEDFAIK